MSLWAALIVAGAAIVSVGIASLAYVCVQLARESEDVPRLDVKR